jgi:hypothetical protein
MEVLDMKLMACVPDMVFLLQQYKLLWILCLPVSLLIPAPRGLCQIERIIFLLKL